jgi:hypothetical protein
MLFTEGNGGNEEDRRWILPDPGISWLPPLPSVRMNFSPEVAEDTEVRIFTSALSAI